VAVTYTIQESGDAVQVDVRREVSLWERIVCAGFGGVALWWLTSKFLPVPARALLTIAGVTGVLFLFRGLRSRLVATKFEFVVDGVDLRGSEGEVSSRATAPILTSKVYRLEYQEHESGGQGIYAVTATGEPLVLPHVDAAQAQEIIVMIKKKFPGLAELWKKSEAAAAKSAREKSGGLF
jgi:hypothetical protein